MTARAMWKAKIVFGDACVPVKLYSAIEDRNVHFRLLHAEDRSPVKQAMVNPQTDEVVPYERIRRAWLSDDGDLVILDDDELEALEPKASREVEILKFLPAEAIDHRWYDRPYYLGPDDDEDAYFALARALDRSRRVGLAQWVMRGKEYVGALRLHAGYPMLVSLRHAEEVVPADQLQPPSGRELDKRELDMARQLIGMLAADFEPDSWHDQYRERVRQLIEDKAAGREVKVVPFRRPKASEDIAGALAASLKAAKRA